MKTIFLYAGYPVQGYRQWIFGMDGECTEIEYHVMKRHARHTGTAHFPGTLKDIFYS